MNIYEDQLSFIEHIQMYSKQYICTMKLTIQSPASAQPHQEPVLSPKHPLKRFLFSNK